jgi:predicted SprT family Zn-dependent metalloprotease
MSYDREAQALADEWLEKARALYPGHDIPDVRVKLNKRLRTTAGRSMPLKRLIDLNADFWREHPNRMRSRTIPHEVAHHVDWYVYRKHGHGRTWKRIMRELGVEDDRRCHDYEAAKRKKRTMPRPHVYVCDCPEGEREHRLTTRQHNICAPVVTCSGLVTRRRYYTCTVCKSKLKHVRSIH